MIIFLCVVLYIPDAGVHAGDICSWAIVCMVLRRIRLEQMTAFFLSHLPCFTMFYLIAIQHFFLRPFPQCYI